VLKTLLKYTTDKQQQDYSFFVGFSKVVLEKKDFLDAIPFSPTNCTVTKIFQSYTEVVSY